MLTPEAVRKKLENLQPTQESVETVSLWCLHHKDSATLVVSTWLQIFKNAGTEKQRLSLFYLANDVCQKGKKRKGHDYMTVFVPALKEALLLSRLDSIRQNIERVLNIWYERNVFDASVIKEFKSVLDASAASATTAPTTSVVETQSAPWPTDNEKIITDFNLSNLIGEVEKHHKYAEVIERLRVVLPSTSVSDGNVKALLKSRQEGQRHYDDVNQSYKKWTEFVDECEKRLKRHHHLIIALERAQIFYETQLNEAGIVQTAYDKFGNGVKSVREKLQKMRSSGDYNYMASPVVDAPSPNPYDDPFAEGVEAVVAAKKDSDKLEAVDMDLDDDVKFAVLPETSRAAVTHETAIGGMKLATNQSFFNNPPSEVASNGASFNVIVPEKRAKLDPRQQKNSHSGSVAIDNSAPPVQPHYPTGATTPAPPVNSSAWQPAPMVRPLLPNSTYPSTFTPNVNTRPIMTPLLQTPPNVAAQSTASGFHAQNSNYGASAQSIGMGQSPYAGPSSAAGLDSGGKVFEYDHGMASNLGPPVVVAAGVLKQRGSNANNLTVLSTGTPSTPSDQEITPTTSDMHPTDHIRPVKHAFGDVNYFEPVNPTYGGRPFPADPRQYRPTGRGGQPGVGRY